MRINIEPVTEAMRSPVNLDRRCGYLVAAVTGLNPMTVDRAFRGYGSGNTRALVRDAVKRLGIPPEIVRPEKIVDRKI